MADHLCRRFRGVTAVADVSLRVATGARFGIIGPNGAGKTTLFNLLSGELRPTTGSVALFGRDITRLRTYRRATLGLGRTFQITRIFSDLTVLENLTLALHGLSPSKFSLLRPWRSYRAMTAEAAELAASFGLAQRLAAPASDLSHGEVRELEVLLALALKPRVLLLDEPAAGLSPAERVDIQALLTSLPAELTLIMIEHDIDVLRGVVDSAAVLHLGSLVVQGTMRDIQNDERVRELYLGGAASRAPAIPPPGDTPLDASTPRPARQRLARQRSARRRPARRRPARQRLARQRSARRRPARRRRGQPARGRAAGGQAMIEVRDLHTYRGINYVLQGVSLRISDGSCTVLLGRNGMGKTTLVHTIMGMLRPATGAIMLDDEELTGKQPFQIAQRGLALVPQGRRIFPSLTVEENLTLAARRTHAGEAWTPERVYELFPQLKQRTRHQGSQLSGGELQMLAIGRALLTNPRLLLMDEPSEGLAPVIVERIGEVLTDLRRGGLGIFLVEQNYGLALGAADVIYILSKGQVVWQGTASELAGAAAVRETHLGV